MTVDSITVAAWLTVTAVLSWVSPRKYQRHAMIASTWAFLLYFDYLSLIILAVFALTAFYVPRTSSFSSRILFILILSYSLVFIALKTLNTFGQGYLIPLGLSFYSFRVIHYLFEGYKDRLPTHGCVDFLAYLFFLPTLVTGPIHRFPSFEEDLRERRWCSSRVSSGLERILYGYAKIVLLGNYLVIHKLSHFITSIESGSPAWHAYLSCVHYWLNLYLQFSGYTDIAIGFSMLMGFKVMENFNMPFVASNIGDFWSRWHISLSTWIRDYVYAPLAASTRRRFFAIAVAMLVFGLWHEFSTKYIFWGLYHAFGITVWHQFQRFKQAHKTIHMIANTRLFSLFAWCLTFNFVILSSVIRRLVFDVFLP